MSVSRVVIAVFVVSVALSGAAPALAAEDAAGSGFLPDYGKLAKDPDYPESKMWVSPEAKSGNYASIIVDPVAIHLSAALIKDGARPDPNLLNEVVGYLQDALNKEFAVAGWKVVDKPTDNSLRYRAAITGIKAEGGGNTNPVDFLPAIFVLRTVTGASSAKAHVFMESYYSDALTGDVVAEVLQGAAGSSVGGDQISLDNVKGVLDQWAKKAAEGSAKALR